VDRRVAILVLLEKTVTTGPLIPHISGVLMAAAGAWLVSRAL